MRVVPLRSEKQTDVQALHRARERMLQQRLALTNPIRGILLDRGIEIAQGFYALRTVLAGLLERENAELTPVMRDLGRLLPQRWNQTEQIIEELKGRIGRLAGASDLCLRLQAMRGVGVLLATATVSAVGNGADFRRARDLSAWVGIIPRQFSTGGNTRLLGIKKRGNSYLDGC